MAVKNRIGTAMIPEGVTEEKRFYCVDGCVYSNLNDMAVCLTHMSSHTFAYHVGAANNDFSNWVRYVLYDDRLASDLMKAEDATSALKIVRKRIGQLKKNAG